VDELESPLESIEMIDEEEIELTLKLKHDLFGPDRDCVDFSSA